MARINIEECWWSDPRRSKLIRLLGGDTRAADGLAIEAWRLAQEFWKHDRQLVPLSHFEALEAGDKLIESGLAVVRDGAVYVRGSSQYLEWIHEEREARRLGGLKSAERPRDEKGRLLPAQPKATPADIQLISSSTPAEPSSIQVSASSSGSKENTYEPPDGSSSVKLDFDLEKLYQGYPRKKGKTPGMKKLAKEVRSRTDYENLARAIENYNTEVAGRPLDKILYFSSFASQWKDWIEVDPDIQFSVNTKPITLEAP